MLPGYSFISNEEWTLALACQESIDDDDEDQ
jgi:hypothetical protein